MSITTTTNVSITRTIYAAELQTASFLGIPYVISPKSTLNERFNIQAASVIPDGVYPTAGYYAIGFGGHANTTGADGTPLTTEVPHLTTDVSNYKPLPFVLRNVNDDLTPLQRSRFALRKLETYDAESYYAYYLCRIDKTGVVTQKQIHTLGEDGTTTVVAFIPGDSNLVPVPPELSNAGINVLQAKHAVVTAPLPISLSLSDIDEIKNAALIIYGDERYALITELALCTGVDKNITLTDTTTFKEAIGVQIAAFTGAGYQLRYINENLTTNLDVGVSAALLKIQG